MLLITLSLGVLLVPLLIFRAWYPRIKTTFDGTVPFLYWLESAVRKADYDYAVVMMPGKAGNTDLIRVPKTQRDEIGNHPASVRIVIRKRPFLKPFIDQASFDGRPSIKTETFTGMVATTIYFVAGMLLMVLSVKAAPGFLQHALLYADALAFALAGFVQGSVHAAQTQSTQSYALSLRSIPLASTKRGFIVSAIVIGALTALCYSFASFLIFIPGIWLAWAFGGMVGILLGKRVLKAAV